jgi:hypothetical protein
MDSPGMTCENLGHYGLQVRARQAGGKMMAEGFKASAFSIQGA